VSNVSPKWTLRWNSDSWFLFRLCEMPAQKASARLIFGFWLGSLYNRISGIWPGDHGCWLWGNTRPGVPCYHSTSGQTRDNHFPDVLRHIPFIHRYICLRYAFKNSFVGIKSRGVEENPNSNGHSVADHYDDRNPFLTVLDGLMEGIGGGDEQ